MLARSDELTMLSVIVDIVTVPGVMMATNTKFGCAGGHSEVCVTYDSRVDVGAFARRGGTSEIGTGRVVNAVSVVSFGPMSLGDISVLGCHHVIDAMVFPATIDGWPFAFIGLGTGADFTVETSEEAWIREVCTILVVLWRLAVLCRRGWTWRRG